VYDGVFEVLQWLLFLSALPFSSDGVVRNGKSTAGHQRYALTAVKHGNCSSHTASQPGTHQKIIDMAMNEPLPT
jgi:transposase-like protein